MGGPVNLEQQYDFESFAEELFEIFEEFDDDEEVIITNPNSWANLNSNQKKQRVLNKHGQSLPKSIILEKPMVLASVVEAPTVKIVNDTIVDVEEVMKNQAVGQFLEAEVRRIDAEAVLESEENPRNQAKNQTVADQEV